MDFNTSQMNIFEHTRRTPLAHRVRPTQLNQFFGHQKICSSEESLIKKWLKNKSIPSLILWGPPGCGKTTLAHLIGQEMPLPFRTLSAISAGIKDIKAYQNEFSNSILFVDEIHRFNKAQQDALLPIVESGKITLIGATTENPSFEINAALLSRLKVIRFEALEEEDLNQILLRALAIESISFKFEKNALEWISKMSHGDARKALNTLENVLLSLLGTNKNEKISLKDIQKIISEIENQPIRYDKKSEEHYNTISAFIKSMRASDPDAALYYLARMLEGGEDPLFIVRRMVIFASEDIGNADPRALQITLAVKDAVHFVGLPEAQINLAHGVTYLSCAPKSRSVYNGIKVALNFVKETGPLSVPMHLRNAPTQLMKEMGYGTLDPKNKSNLPKQAYNKEFYTPTESGLEKKIKEWKQKKK